MTPAEYGAVIAEYDVSAGIGHWYYALGLAGEAGETVDKLKKVYRDRGGEFSDDDRKALGLELGDVLWYLTRLADRLGLTLEEVMVKNVEKLASRAERGKLHGAGDNR